MDQPDLDEASHTFETFIWSLLAVLRVASECAEALCVWQDALSAHLYLPCAAPVLCECLQQVPLFGQLFDPWLADILHHGIFRSRRWCWQFGHLSGIRKQALAPRIAASGLCCSFRW